MKSLIHHRSILVCLAVFLILPGARSQTTSPSVKEETVTYTADGVTMKGFIAYNENIRGPSQILMQQKQVSSLICLLNIMQQPIKLRGTI